MSSDISPSLVNWMTSMMTMRLQVILEHIPITQEQIQSYIVHTQVTQQTHTCMHVKFLILRIKLDVMVIQGKQIPPMSHLHDAAAQASGCFCSVCLELCNCKSFFVTHSKQKHAVTDKSLHVATYVCRSVQISC